MSGSVLSGLSLRGTAGVLALSYPGSLCDPGRAEAVARRLAIAFSSTDVAWSVEGAFGTLKRFFAELHGFALYPKAPLSTGPEPHVSCIVVVNENLRFVDEQLVPSLAAHASGHALEVILVLNGSAAPDQPPAGVRVVQGSAWGAVAAAYNAGAKAARGRYLALLHDDCVIDDPAWIDKCVAALEEGAGAVAGEFRRLERVAGMSVPALPVAKCVPLVMRRADFAACGGFDEFHYVGYEDLDFTLTLLRRGVSVLPADLRLRHYGGMSSTLKYCPVPGLAELHALCALPPAAIIRRFREFVERGVRIGDADLMRLGLDVQLLYVLKKHRDFLATLDDAYAAAGAALERALTRASPFDATLILPRFREMDRALYGGPSGDSGAAS